MGTQVECKFLIFKLLMRDTFCRNLPSTTTCLWKNHCLYILWFSISTKFNLIQKGWKLAFSINFFQITISFAFSKFFIQKLPSIVKETRLAMIKHIFENDSRQFFNFLENTHTQEKIETKILNPFCQ